MSTSIMQCGCPSMIQRNLRSWTMPSVKDPLSMVLRALVLVLGQLLEVDGQLAVWHEGSNCFPKHLALGSESCKPRRASRTSPQPALAATPCKHLEMKHFLQTPVLHRRSSSKVWGTSMSMEILFPASLNARTEIATAFWQHARSERASYVNP